MIELTRVRENKQEVIDRLKKRPIADIEQRINTVESLDAEKRKIQQEAESLQAEMNAVSKEIGKLMASGKKEEAEAARTKTGNIKSTIQSLNEKLAQKDQELLQLLYTIPNTPSARVPVGKTPEENAIVFTEGSVPELHENAQPHWELAAKYNLIDFELGVKITGAGFPVYKGKGAKLQRALISFFLDEAIAAGYGEMIPPLMVNEDSGFGTGQLPDKEGQMYHDATDNLYLIPTAEVPLTNVYRDVILKEEEFPVKICGYTPCFRREAGSYGKDVRGLNRLHQFDKVEIVQLQHPDKSYETLEQMVEHVKGLLQKLELPYRVALLCGGDMGFASAMTYDMEVFSAAQQRWLEVSSISNFETFQANRLKLRYKDATGKTKLAHTLNGSALALPRIVASLLENNQTPEGIKIPKALVPYTGFDIIN
ncbi:MAG TPA: serine--tRNA ligase [Flavobacteriales bacterium]|nr:serine--tRNA ligase [Flavobacteriales bacterium]